MTKSNFTLDIQGSPEPDPPAWEGAVPAPSVPYPAAEARAPLPAESDWGWDFSHHVLARGQRITLAITAPAGWSIVHAEVTLDGQRQNPALPADHAASIKLAFVLDSYSPGARHRATAMAQARRQGEDQEITRSWVEEWLDA